jgi:hypothetical protein
MSSSPQIYEPLETRLKHALKDWSWAEIEMEQMLTRKLWNVIKRPTAQIPIKQLVSSLSPENAVLESKAKNLLHGTQHLRHDTTAKL